MLRQLSGHRPFVPSRCAWLAVILVAPALGAGSVARAVVIPRGCITISQLDPYDDHARTPCISGIAFDHEPNPWVIDGLSWQMQRLDENNGAVLQSCQPSPVTSYNDSLAWSAFGGEFYTANQSSLYRINIDSGVRTLVGNSMQLFNFMDLAFDPLGKLWLATDRNGGELWSVDTATSVPTFERAISGLGLNQQIHAFAIDEEGGFLVASSAFTASGSDNHICGLDPITGGTRLLTDWTDDPGAFIVDMDIDRATGRWFGIREARAENPRGFYLVELIGVPEPASMALIVSAAACALTIRRPRLMVSRSLV